MTQTYKTKSGEVMDVNIAGNEFLSKITLYLWDKIGIPRPLSAEDCYLVVRKLSNYITIQSYWKDVDKVDEFYTKNYGLQKDSKKTIDWLISVRNFFERAAESGGLVDEDV